MEPEGGRQGVAIRQPWYPVQERYGLVFAYMGPPARKPVLPRCECLEVLPALRVVPNPRVAQFARVESIGWVLPIDDTSFRIYVAGRVREAGEIGRRRSNFGGRFWWVLAERNIAPCRGL